VAFGSANHRWLREVRPLACGCVSESAGLCLFVLPFPQDRRRKLELSLTKPVFPSPLICGICGFKFGIWV
jgi:hypothetical protein